MDPNHPLPLAFVIVGTVSSSILGLSPIPMILEVWKSKSTGCFRPDAFIISLPFGLANGAYSLYSDQLVSFISTAIIFTLYSIYLSVFVYFDGKNRRAILRKACIWLSSGALITGLGPIVFLIVDSSESGNTWLDGRGGLDGLINKWLGVCATISIILLFSGQLTNMIHVVKSRDARSISTSMMLGGLFASISWLVYASLILDPFYMIPNGLGVLSGIILVILKLTFGRAVNDPSDGSSSPED